MKKFEQVSNVTSRGAWAVGSLSNEVPLTDVTSREVPRSDVQEGRVPYHVTYPKMLSTAMWTGRQTHL